MCVVIYYNQTWSGGYRSFAMWDLELCLYVKILIGLKGSSSVSSLTHMYLIR